MRQLVLVLVVVYLVNGLDDEMVYNKNNRRDECCTVLFTFTHNKQSTQERNAVLLTRLRYWAARSMQQLGMSEELMF